MKSTAWLRGTRSVLVSLVALAVMAVGCTKDAQSQEVATSTASSAPSAKAAPATPDELPATAVAIEKDKLPALPGAGKAAVEPAKPAGASDPTPEPAEKTLGDSSYTLTVDAPAALAKGGSGTVRVKVLPKKGWKMNKEFPTKLKVAAPEGVTVSKAKQTVKDAERFEDKGATFAVQFTADSAGKKSFTADFKFAVCTDATCDPKRQKLAWVVDVN